MSDPVHPSHASSRRSALQTVEPFLETVRMRAFGLGQGLEPFRQFGKALFTRRLGHARIHLRVFVRFAFDGRLQIGFRVADRYACGRIPDLLEKVEMSKGMAGLGLGSVA